MLIYEFDNTKGCAMQQCYVIRCSNATQCHAAPLRDAQVWNEEDAEEEVLAMVVRTGLHTSMGAMMRHIFHNATPSTPRFIKVSYMDVTIECMLMACICCGASAT